MRTTVNLADDVLVAVDRLARRDGTGRSAVINALVRRGLSVGDARLADASRSFRTYAGVLDALDAG